MKKNAHTASAIIENYRVDRERSEKKDFHCDSPRVKSDKQYL